MTAPYSVQVDSATARDLTAKGGAFLFLDVPSGTYVGIDHQVFVSGDAFKGVKMIPPGPHLVSYRAASPQGDISPASSFFVFVNVRDVIVRRWNRRDEMLELLKDEDEAGRFQAGVRRFDFDTNLAPYNLRQYHEWQSLSCHITAELITKLMPATGKISIMAEADAEAPRTDAEKKLQQQLDEGHKKFDHLLANPTAGAGPPPAAEGSAAQDSMEVDATAGEATGSDAAAAHQQQQAGPSGRCRYTDLPRLVKASGATGAQLTALNLDKSAVLLRVAEERYQGRLLDVMGELQFAFVAFVYGQSLIGFRQWKALLGLLLCCEDLLLRQHPEVLLAFLKALTAQLHLTLMPTSQGDSSVIPFEVPFVEELLPDSFLRRLFGTFFQMLHDNHGDLSPEAFSQMKRLQKVLSERLGWDHQVEELGADSDDEYAPVVVDLGANGGIAL